MYGKPVRMWGVLLKIGQRAAPLCFWGTEAGAQQIALRMRLDEPGLTANLVVEEVSVTYAPPGVLMPHQWVKVPVPTSLAKGEGGS